MADAGPTDEVTIPPGLVPPGTTELGIDIIKVDRIRKSIEKFGSRFSNRVLTPSERRYVRDRPETFAGRWAAKEAVSKVLGLGVRGIGWKDIEVVRLPTGQPSIQLHGRAADRAEGALAPRAPRRVPGGPARLPHPMGPGIWRRGRDPARAGAAVEVEQRSSDQHQR